MKKPTANKWLLKVNEHKSMRTFHHCYIYERFYRLKMFLSLTFKHFVYFILLRSTKKLYHYGTSYY